jgi:hypothetical protein
VAKAGDTVDVCHRTGNGNFVLINISADALNAHLAHGDAAPGQAVPGQTGKVFDANCSVGTTVQTEQGQNPPSNNGKKADKVDVCHRTGNGTFILINVNGNALPAHLAHGDGVPEGEVPNQPGKHFTTTCAINLPTQKVVVQTLTVYPTGVSFNSVPLQAGQLYEIKVSGVYYFRTNGDWADAEWYAEQVNGVFGAPQKGDNTLYPYGLDMCINTCPPNIDWGSYQSSHVYTIQWMGTIAALASSL